MAEITEPQAAPDVTKTLTAERLRELLDYDPETGVFRWRVRGPHKGSGGFNRSGDIAGHVCADPLNKAYGYRRLGIGGKSYLAHRLAWLHVTGQWPSGRLDHKNLGRDDNWFTNLREATPAQNNANRPANRGTATGMKGVSYQSRSGRYVAQIGTKYLGIFATPEEAQAAYVAAATEKWGSFARTK